jgi:hypothetical protein
LQIEGLKKKSDLNRKTLFEGLPKEVRQHELLHLPFVLISSTMQRIATGTSAIAT